MKITALIHTWNEEQWIATCIQSVTWADEIVVADMQSTDRTVEIARSMGARILSMERHEWNVERLRNTAVAACDADWIIIVDADETIPATLAARLRELAEAPTADAYALPRKNYFLGYWLEHSFWPDYQPRFVRRGVATWSGDAHQHPTIRGKLENLPPVPELALDHPGYCQDLTRFLTKMVNYSTLEAQRMIREGRPVPWPFLIRRPLEEFQPRFFRDGAWRDGMYGLVNSLLRGFYYMLIGIRIWELTRSTSPAVDPAKLRRSVRFEEFRAAAKWLRPW